MALIQKRHKWVDIRSASSASRDDLIWDDGNGIFGIMQCCIRLDDKREGEFRFLEKRMIRRDCVQSGPHVLGRAVRIRRRVDTCLRLDISDVFTLKDDMYELTFGGRMIGGGG